MLIFVVVGVGRPTIGVSPTSEKITGMDVQGEDEGVGEQGGEQVVKKGEKENGTQGVKKDGC